MTVFGWPIRLVLVGLILTLSTAAIADDKIPRVGLLRAGQPPDPFVIRQCMTLHGAFPLSLR